MGAITFQTILIHLKENENEMQMYLSYFSLLIHDHYFSKLTFLKAINERLYIY